MNELFKIKAKEVLGVEDGLCISCGNPRPKESIAFCQTCAKQLFAAVTKGRTKTEIEKRIAEATKTVKEDIRKTMIEPN